MAFETPLNVKEISEAQKKQSKKLSTIQKTGDLRLQGTHLHDNESYKREKRTKRFHLLHLSCLLPILLNMMGTYRLMRFLYRTKKLPLFYNIHHTSFLNIEYILVVIQLYGGRTNVGAIESQYCTYGVQMKHTYC